MAKLIFILDGSVIREYAVDKERMTVGRRNTNDIHIDNLAVSGEHAAIVSVDGLVYVEDLNSTNGTRVNEKRIKKEALKHGDEIGFGKYLLRFVKEEGQLITDQSDGFAETILVDPRTEAAKKETEPTESESAPEVERVADSASEPENAPEQNVEDVQVKAPRLEVTTGEDAGQTLMLDRSMVKVGQVNQQVAVVTRRGDGYVITHVSGDRHPLVNGQAIGVQAHALSDGDEVEVLDVKMVFHQK